MRDGNFGGFELGFGDDVFLGGQCEPDGCVDGGIARVSGEKRSFGGL